MRRINQFLLQHNLRIAQNPCISPDFCLDWDSLSAAIRSSGAVRMWRKSAFETAAGDWTLLEDDVTGDCAWHLHASAPGAVDTLADGISVGERAAVFPATWDNLLRLKNLVQEHDPASTLFPTSGGTLSRSALGIGARFTTLHWPAVEWAMSALDFGMTANQNSIPRELVYDVDAMLAGDLGTVRFPFIGTSVPEGHQGQSVEGMSHGAVLSKLKTGFHRRGIAWSFNADHQPIGGAFDDREDALVRGCLLASYITFDLSPELAQAPAADQSNLDAARTLFVRERLTSAGVQIDEPSLARLVSTVGPALQKMKRRDDKYRAARERAFTTPVGRAYARELSIDELPGVTAPQTTAVMLALCEALDMRIDFVAPAFGFQKNAAYPDNDGLRALVQAQWDVCRRFDVGIGFHSGSGKSAENYRVMGDITGGRLEIKTSGRYTYEMGVALAASSDPGDAALWSDWYRFTLEMALAGAFSDDPIERQTARDFITASLDLGRRPNRSQAGQSWDEALASFDSVFSAPHSCRAALEALPPSPDYMFFFEYNFLYVLAAGGRADKAALGDHSPAGYQQRARFYAISGEARLNYAKNVAGYIVFVAEHTGLVPASRCAGATARLEHYSSLDELLADIDQMP